jgi:TonB family protein
MAEAEQMLVWTDANCELIPQDSLRRADFPPGVEPVRYLSGGAPIYPRQMKQRMINGKVSMRFIVGCNGRVVPSSLVVISFTDTAFVGPGLAAIQTAQFAPARKDGVPAAQVVEQAISWRMVGGAEPSQFPAPQPWWVSTCPANTCRSARP